MALPGKKTAVTEEGFFIDVSQNGKTAPTQNPSTPKKNQAFRTVSDQRDR